MTTKTNAAKTRPAETDLVWPIRSLRELRNHLAGVVWRRPNQIGVRETYLQRIKNQDLSR